MVFIKFQSTRWAEREAFTLCRLTEAAGFQPVLPAIRRIDYHTSYVTFFVTSLLTLSFPATRITTIETTATTDSPRRHQHSSHCTAFFLGLNYTRIQPHGLTISTIIHLWIIFASILPILFSHLSLFIAGQTGLFHSHGRTTGTGHGQRHRYGKAQVPGTGARGQRSYT